MNLERYLPHFVTLSLLILSGVYHSPAMAFASVVSVLGLLAHGLIASRIEALAAKAPPADEGVKRAQEEAKRLIQDINARVATLEYGVKVRGF